MSFYPPGLPIAKSIPNPNYSKITAPAPKTKQCKNVPFSKKKVHICLLVTSSPPFPLPPGAFLLVGKPKNKKKEKNPNPAPTNLTARKVSKILRYWEFYGKTVTARREKRLLTPSLRRRQMEPNHYPSFLAAFS